MLVSILRFELGYQLRSPAFIAIFGLLFLFVFGAITVDQIQIGSSDAVNINSPQAATTIISVFAIIGMFIPVVFMATAITRDRTLGTDETFRSTPVGPRTMLLGRFFGGLFVTWLAFSSVPLGFLAGSIMPWLDQEQIGPFNPAQVFYIYAVFGLINLGIAGSILFTVANLTRSLLAAWVAMVGLLIGWVVATSLVGELDTRESAALLEPFGLAANSVDTQYWTATEKNTLVQPFSGSFLKNRILWSVIAFGFVALNLAVPNGLRAPGFFSRKKKLSTSPASAALRPVDLPRVTPAPLGAASWLQFRRRVGFETGGIVKSVAFWVVLALSVANTVGALLTVSNMYGTQSYPVTRLMTESILGAFGIIGLVIAVYYTAELVWRERTHKFNDIVDASPTPSWVLVSAKFVSVMMILTALAVVAAMTAIVTQLLRGYDQIEAGQYAIRLAFDFVVGIGFLAVLALFFQVLTNNKWLGIGAILAFFVVSLITNQIGFEHVLYSFGLPGWIAWSDMNGGGHYIGIQAWLTAYWALFSALLAIATFLLWNRGTLEKTRSRLLRLPGRYTRTTATASVAALLGMVGIGGWIFFNTNLRNEYVTAEDGRDRAEAFEARWRAFEFAPQPVITAIDVQADLYPNQRRYTVEAEIAFANKTDQALTTAHLDYAFGTEVVSHRIEGAKISQADEDANHFVFTFEPALRPGEERSMIVATTRQNPGFRNAGNGSSIVANGTFINRGEALPTFGWGRDKIISDRAERRKRDLPQDLRAPKLEDERFWSLSPLGAGWIDFRAEITTSADQIAIAPGYLVSDETTGDRRTFVYEQDTPIQDFFSIQSANYEVAEGLWDAPDGLDDVTLQVFYDEAHPYNVDRMLKAMEISLARFSEAFSPFQYRQMRVQEFPYQSFAQSFPNTVPYSENIGFIQRLEDEEALKDAKIIDAVTYVIAHEVAHQWFGHQLSAAPVQGSTMLIESFAQYGALLVMEDVYGKPAMRRFLRFELDGYLRGRAGEPIEELPLYRVENQPYIHYQKGGLVMYLLRDMIGEQTVNAALARTIEEWGYRSDPYPRSVDFLRILRAEAGPEHDALITDLFERIVVWDVEAEEAVVTEREDGRFDVAVEVRARKLIADGAGVETEEDFNFPMDIGVFKERPGDAGAGADHILFFQKRDIRQGDQTITVTVDERPGFVGVDPYNKLIDRTPADNLTAVEPERPV